MEDYERRFEIWKKAFIMESSLITSDYSDCSWDNEARAHSETFESRLIALCQEYGFDPVSPKYIGDDWEDGVQPDAGKLGSFVGEHLIEALLANRRYRDGLPNESAQRRGPGRTWTSIQAEAILVGLKLLEDSREGLELIRRFLKSHDTRSDVLTWKDQQILYLQRIVLSAGKRTIIANFSKCRSEQERLIERVRKKAHRLAEHGHLMGGSGVGKSCA